METQSKMVRQLVFIKEQSQLLVKETSGRLGEDFIFGNKVYVLQWNANLTFRQQRKTQDFRIFHLTSSRS